MHCVWGALEGNLCKVIMASFKGFGSFRSSGDDITWFLATYELMEQLELLSHMGMKRW